MLLHTRLSGDVGDNAELNYESPGGKMTIVVGICTCRSPDGLARALGALAGHMTKYPFEVIVVDNDVGEAGRPVVEAFSGRLSISYYLEPRAGIPFARNALIAAARKRNLHHLVMFDDDEQPLPGWLDSIVDTAHSTNAAVVGGAVVPVFEKDPVLPVIRSDFEKLAPAYFGGIAAIDSTANILLSGRLLREWDEEFFDSRFQYSGGSDSELLRRISKRGYVHAFSEGAVVVEDIPYSRCSESWLLKRNYRNGNVLGRVTAFHSGHLTAIRSVGPRAIVLWLRGLVRSRFAGKDVRKAYLARKDMARGGGMLAALRGSVMQEYAEANYRKS